MAANQAITMLERLADRLERIEQRLTALEDLLRPKNPEHRRARLNTSPYTGEFIKRAVASAEAIGIRPAAREYNVAVTTLRKWCRMAGVTPPNFQTDKDTRWWKEHQGAQLEEDHPSSNDAHDEPVHD